ncbi:hypothetical protein HYU95_03910 [Candidatus Daviesbacteria bacterium]|nr:hypothetical protein [Candidatus Daviesbacteria bacterium]
MTTELIESKATLPDEEAIKEAQERKDRCNHPRYGPSNTAVYDLLDRLRSNAIISDTNPTNLNVEPERPQPDSRYLFSSPDGQLTVNLILISGNKITAALQLVQEVAKEFNLQANLTGRNRGFEPIILNGQGLNGIIKSNTPFYPSTVTFVQPSRAPKNSP